MVEGQHFSGAGGTAPAGTLRRGLPRTPGGEPWPPAGRVPQVGERAGGGGARLEATAAAAPSGLETAPAAPPRPTGAAAAPPVEGAAAAPLVEAGATAAASAEGAAAAASVEEGAAAAPSVEEGAAEGRSRHETPAAVAATSVRRGLPRVPGGEPWPPAGTTPLAAERADGVAARLEPTAAGPTSAPSGLVTAPAAPPRPTGDAAGADTTAAAAPPVEEGAAGGRSRLETTADAGSTSIRRGLPRVAGGEPWPPAGSAPAAASSSVEERADVVGARLETTDSSAASAAGGLVTAPAAPPRPTEEVTASAADGLVTAPAAPPRPTEEVTAPAADGLVTAPAAPPRPAEEEQRPAARAAQRPAARAAQPPAAKAARSGETVAPGLRPVGAKQWLAASVLVALAVVGLATIVVAIVRWLMGLEPVAAFVERYPGTYALPEGAPVGIPAWLNWSHFFNILLIALIIRSGLQVRRERKPPAYVTSRRTGTKVSLTVWLHTSVDVLWVVNGLVFVVLLFATGQWMRIVPTSWEVFPHAISTALQYASLDWPLEDGWVHYNAMQQLAYFGTVFIAAPLAIITGVRMSGWWPKDAERLNRAYPIEWARAVHFPTMLYFVAFIVVHVLLVFTTGALRNLNHMFAAKPDDDWLGFLFFAGAMLVTAAAVIAARPALLTPIASRFGTVSAR